MRVEGPEPWCAPDFFVPKADGISVRMVTDFTKIKKIILDQYIHFHRSKISSSAYLQEQLSSQKWMRYTDIFS